MAFKNTYRPNHLWQNIFICSANRTIKNKNTPSCIGDAQNANQPQGHSRVHAVGNHVGALSLHQTHTIPSFEVVREKTSEKIFPNALGFSFL